MGGQTIEYEKVKKQGSIFSAFAKTLYTASLAAPVFTVRITDNPASFKGLIVEVVEVEVYSLDGGWQAMDIVNARFDVLQLTNGRELELAQKKLNQGKIEIFTHLRIKFGANNVLLVEDEEKIKNNHLITKKQINLYLKNNNLVEIELETPVVFSTNTAILIDFDVSRSVRFADPYFELNPVITHISDPDTGFWGIVPGSQRAIVYATNFKETFSAYTNMTGAFLMRGIEPANYTILTRPLKSKLRLPNQKQSWFTEVEVVQGEISEVYFQP